MIQYAVIKGGSGWDVYMDGARFERHADRLDAIESAYAQALAVEADGAQVELLVQDEGGELEAWSLARWSSLVRSAPASVHA